MFLAVELVHHFFEFAKQIVVDVGFLPQVIFGLLCRRTAVIAALELSCLHIFCLLVRQEVVRIKPMTQAVVFVVVQDVLRAGSQWIPKEVCPVVLEELENNVQCKIADLLLILLENIAAWRDLIQLKLKCGQKAHKLSKFFLALQLHDFVHVSLFFLEAAMSLARLHRE